MRWESIFPNLCKSYNLMRNVDLKKWKMYLLPASDAEAEEIWCRTPGKFLWWRWRFNLSFQGTRSQSRAERLDQVPALATHHQDLIFFLKTQTRQKTCMSFGYCCPFAWINCLAFSLNLVWSLHMFTLENNEPSTLYPDQWNLFWETQKYLCFMFFVLFHLSCLSSSLSTYLRASLATFFKNSYQKGVSDNSVWKQL